MDLRDEIEHWQRVAERLKEENRELLADREALLKLAAEQRERLAQYEDGAPGEPAES